MPTEPEKSAFVALKSVVERFVDVAFVMSALPALKSVVERFVAVAFVRVEFVAKRNVDEALVLVLYTLVRFWNVDWFATPVPVALIVVKVPMSEERALAKKFVVVAEVPVALVHVRPWKAFVPLQSLSVVVPKAKVRVRSALKSPPPWSG